MKNSKKIIAGVLATTVLFSFAGCDSTSGSKKKDKKDKDSDTKELIEVAEDYTDALGDLDLDKIIKLSSDYSKGDFNNYENDLDQYGSFFKAIAGATEFEIDEDSAKIDDDEGSVKVTYEIPNVFGTIYEDCDDLKEDLKSTKETIKGKFTIEFEIDDDEYLVSNTDDIVGEFLYDTIETLDIAFSPEVMPENDLLDLDYSFFLYPERFIIDPDEEIGIEIVSYDLDGLSEADVTAVVCDEDGNELCSMDITIYPNSDVTYYVSPAECGLSEFESGKDYTFTVSYKDYDYSDSDYVTISSTSSSTVTPDIDDNNNTAPLFIGDFVQPTSDKYGHMDGTTYINDYFGFSIDMVDLCYDYCAYPEDIHPSYDDPTTDYVYDFIGFRTEDLDSGVAISITSFNASEDSDTLQFPDISGTDSIIQDFGGVQVLCLGNNRAFFIIKDNELLEIEFRPSTTEDWVWLTDVMGTLKAI